MKPKRVPKLPSSKPLVTQNIVPKAPLLPVPKHVAMLVESPSSNPLTSQMQEKFIQKADKLQIPLFQTSTMRSAVQNVHELYKPSNAESLPWTMYNFALMYPFQSDIVDPLTKSALISQFSPRFSRLINGVFVGEPTHLKLSLVHQDVERKFALKQPQYLALNLNRTDTTRKILVISHSILLFVIEDISAYFIFSRNSLFVSVVMPIAWRLPCTN